MSLLIRPCVTYLVHNNRIREFSEVETDLKYRREKSKSVIKIANLLMLVPDCNYTWPADGISKLCVVSGYEEIFLDPVIASHKLS